MGSLRQTPAPILLLGLHRDGFSGEARLVHDGRARRFTWRAGAPVAVDSGLPREGLVDVLLERELLDEAGAARVRELVQRKGVTPLQAVAALKQVPPRELVLGLAAQIRRALLACLALEDGSFELDPGPAGEAAPPLPLDVVEVVCEGVAAHWRPDQVLQALATRATRYPQRGPAFEAIRARLPQGPELDALCQRVDGRTATFAVLQGAPPRTGALLWVLHGLGAFVWHDEPVAGEAAAGESEAEDAATSEPEIELVVSGPGAEAARSAAEAAAARREATLDAKTASVRDEVISLYERLDEIDHFELLGVPRGSDPRAVKKAYLKAAKRLHPDKLAKLGLEEIKEKANEVFARIAHAVEVLSDPDERRSYEASLDGHEQVDANRVAQAESFYRKGALMMRAGNFLGAVEFLQSAVMLWPEEAEYQADLAWSLHRKNPPENERALEHFEKAVELDTGQARVWLRMALVVKELGDAPRASELTAKARELDPDIRA